MKYKNFQKLIIEGNIEWINYIEIYGLYKQYT